MHRKELIPLLEGKKYDDILEAAKKEAKATFRLLIGLTYDKSDVVCWRAIEVVGLIARELAKTQPDIIRALAQRFLWMLRDESGNNLSSAPEMLGEIVRNSPEAFADIAPVIASFHDEVMLLPGVLRAVFRIAEVRPDLIEVTGDFLGPFLKDSNPHVRLYALLLAGVYKLEETFSAVAVLRDDGDAVVFYDRGDLTPVKVGQTARRILQQFSGQEN